jgi:hypothetical protein
MLSRFLNGSTNNQRNNIVRQKAGAAKCGDERPMLWVDNDTYFGPDRRRADRGLRWIDRRHANSAVTPPPLTTALRQLRLRVLDAQGAGVDAFVDRVQGTAALAEIQNEPEVAFELSNVGVSLNRTSLLDARMQIYKTLDRAHEMLRAA